MLRGHLVKRHCVTDGESEARIRSYSECRVSSSLLAVCTNSVFATAHLTHVPLVHIHSWTVVTGSHSEEQPLPHNVHCSLLTVSAFNQYQMAPSDLLFHLTHFFCLVFSPPLPDLFLIRILFYLSLSALRWEDIGMPTTKRPCWLT